MSLNLLLRGTGPLFLPFWFITGFLQGLVTLTATK